MMSGMNRYTAETVPYESKLSKFKVDELRNLLHAFNLSQIGEKAELFARCIDLLRSPTMTRSVIDKIRQIENRENQRANPYPLPTRNNNQHPQQKNASTASVPPLCQRQNNSYDAYGGNTMPNLNPIGMGMLPSPRGTMTIHPSPARNLTPLTLPFYEVVYTVLEPKELPASNGSKAAAVQCQFTLLPEHHMKLFVKEDEFPRIEVQLRFFNVTGDILNIEQPDDFPPNCSVKINDYLVTLPNLIPTDPNKKVEPKRESKPVNITKYVICQPEDKTHRMTVDWTADKRLWAVAINLVTHVNSDILRVRIVRAPSFHLPYETTEATIRKRYGGGDDDDVAVDSLKISLLCPLGKTRMKIAARSRDCTHIQCFDLDLHLQLNEKRPTWKCGVCNGNAPYHKLIIDKYFMKMLHDLDTAVTDVELLKDGSYRVIGEEECCDISDDDDAPAQVGESTSSPTAAAASFSTSSSAAPSTPAASTPKKAVAEDTITLSDDEEDQELRKLIRAYKPGSMNNTPVKAQKSSSSDDDKIILGETPPRPVDHRLPVGRSADRPILTDSRQSPSSSPESASTPTSSWSSLSSSSSVSTSSTSTEGVTSPSGTTTGGGGMYAGEMRANNLHDVPNQQTQPQPAPPILDQRSYNQQMQSAYGGYINAMHYSQAVQDHFYAAQAAYQAQASHQQWSLHNGGGPVYRANANGTGGVIRRQEEPR